MSSIHRLLDRLKMVYGFFKLTKNLYNFDFSSIYLILRFQLASVYKALKNGMAIHEKSHMSSLRRASLLSSRLYKGKHDDKYFTQFEKDFGPVLFRHFNEPLTPEQSKALTKVFDQSNADSEADKKELFDLLRTNIEYWWD